MNNDLRRQFVLLMTKCSKVNTTFPSLYNLQFNEMGILHTIFENSPENCQRGINLDMASIQEQLQISKPTISYTLNSLEKKEYIMREIDPKDRRRITVHITEEGLAAWKLSNQKHENVWNQLVEEFGEDDLNQLTQLLARFFEVIDNIFEGESLQ